MLKLSFLDDQLVFCFQSGVSGEISALMLEPYFLSRVAELTYENPGSELFLLGPHSFNAIFCVVTLYGVDLLYHTTGTGR